MKKLSYLLTLFFAFFALIIFSSGTVSAQEASLNQRWVCLDLEWCGDRAGTSCSGEGQPAHRAKISTKEGAKALLGADAYIVECFSVDGATMCTTGTPENDATVFSENRVAQLNSSVQYRYDGMYGVDGKTVVTNPVRSTVSGEIGPFEWQSMTPGNLPRKFLAVNFFSGENAQPGSAGGQQQGTLEFEVAKADCVSFSWDPYGRVFDAKTLEPVKGATVQLMLQRASGEYTVFNASELKGFGTFKNPQVTRSEGAFNFVVPDGTYKLAVSAPGYKFPGALSSLAAGYEDVYSDIYPAQTGEAIVQKGQIQHRDIPLEVAAGSVSQNNPVELLEYFITLDKGRSVYVVEGRVSHPLTKVQVWTDKEGVASSGKENFRVAATANADAGGKFKVMVDQNSLDEGEYVSEIELIKKTLASPQAGLVERIMSYIIPDVNAQSSTVQVDLPPIPNYIEGIAYDASNNPMAGATVEVFMERSKKAFYTTTADELGYFRVSSENLPFMPYTLRYTSTAGVSVSVPTKTFLSQNDAYLKDNNVNVNQYETQDGEVLENAGINNEFDKMSGSDSAKSVLSQPFGIALAILVIVMLVVIAVLLVLLVRKKKMGDIV